MLKRPCFSFLLICLMFCMMIHPSVLLAHPSSFLFALDSSKWIGTGFVKSIPSNQSKSDILDWKPQHKSSFLKTTAVPLNWSQYEEIEITLFNHGNFESWLNIIICDKKNSPAVTYIETDFTGLKTFHLTFQDSFPSFNRTKQVDWKHIAYFALETHTIAEKDVAQLEITIEKVEIKTKEEKKPLSFPVLSPDQKKSIFFSESFFAMIHQNQEAMVQTLVQKVDTIAQNARLTKEISSESLFYLVLYAKIHQQSFDFSLLTAFSALFQPSYWDAVLKQNDILVQENGLFFLLVYDLLRNDLLSRSTLNTQFQTILEHLAEVELNQCQYWIYAYPYGQGNNHVTRAASFLAILAYYHQNLAKRSTYYQYALQVLDYYFGFQIDSDGVLNEGTHYYVYLMEVLAYYGYFEWIAQGRSLFQDFSFSPKLERMMDWANTIKMPNGYLPAVDDAWQTKVTFPPRLVISFVKDKAKANSDSICYDSSSAQNGFAWNLEKPLYIPLWLFGAGETYETNGLNEFPSKIFPLDSQVVFRKNWLPESSYVFFSGKRQPSLHEHDDAGQVQLFAHQNPILLESGYGPAGWSSNHRDYYAGGSAHNTVTIDSVGPKAYYNGSIGPIDKTEILESNINYSLQYAVMEINRNSLFRATKWIRSVFYIPETPFSPYYCLILDQMSSPEEHIYECLFHPNGSDIQQNGSLTKYSMPLPNGQGSITTELHALIPKPTTLKKGYYSAYWGSEIGTRYIAYKDKSKECTFATMITSKTSQETAKITPISLSGKRDRLIHEYAFSVQKNQETSQDVLFRNPSGNMIQGQWVGTNATTAYVRTNKLTPTNGSYVGIQCSYMNFQQNPLFYAQKKIDYIYFTGSSELYDYYMEYESSELSNTIYLNLFDISNILLDNKEIEMKSFSGGVSFQLPPGKHHVIFKKKGDK